MSVPRLYRALLGLLPWSITERDRREIGATFAALWGEARTGRRRVRVVAVSFGRLPLVIGLEWRDHLRGRRTARRKGEGMHGLWSGARQGVRSLAGTPSFTWSVVLLLGLGVGAVTSIFSVVDHVVLRPLPYPAAERLVKMENGSHSAPTFRRFEAMRTVERWAGIFARDANLTGDDEPVRLYEGQVTRDYFAMFGGRPAAGRLFVTEDFGGGDGLVLTHGMWRRVFGGDPGVVGRTLRIDGEPRVVVGVMDASFVQPEGLRSGVDFWRPIDWSDEIYQTDDFHVLQIAGRLAPGATVEQAQAEADVIAARRAEEAPDNYVGRDGSVSEIPVTPLREATVGGVRRGLGLILAAVSLLLLVACVNVAHLFMARGVERTREMSVRRALGAGTGALARQLGIESMLVGLGGAVVGVALAVAGIGAFRAFGPEELPRMDAIAVDPRVMAFAVGIGLATALAFGLLPALRLTRGGAGRENPLHLAARGSTPTRRMHAVRHGLVVVEVALSLVLAAQAGWLIRSFADLHAVDLGFRTADVWTLPLTPTNIEDPEDWNRRAEAMRIALQEVPGVDAATYGLSMPLENVGGNRCCWRTRPDIPGVGDDVAAMMHPVASGFFDLFDLRLVAGRSWTPQEARAPGGAGAGGAVPVVVTEPFAVQAFGAASGAIGREMAIDEAGFRVVGVVADNRHYGPDQEHGPAVYMPATALPFGPGLMHMAVRTDGPRPGLPRALAEAVWRVEPELPVPVVRSMEEWASVATARARFLSGLFTAFGAVAMLLVAGGLAGTLLYTVRVRRRELGIRLALGATPRGVEGSVLRRGVALAVSGTIVGGIGAWMSGRLLTGLVGVEARHAGAFAVTVAVLLAVALVASWLPARRAAATDPMETLRVE
jgi:putative ABC transport system permease protein